MADGSPTRLLIIDDDTKLCRLVADYLGPLGYAVEAAHTGPEGLKRATEEPFAAVILDVMLPGLNGFDVLRELRAKSQVPVLMLTALGDEPDRIVGLEMGADDYLPKTFSTRELLARLRAVLRRSAVTARAAEAAQDSTAVVGGLRIEIEARSASIRGWRETRCVHHAAPSARSLARESAMGFARIAAAAGLSLRQAGRHAKTTAERPASAAPA